MGEIVRSDLSLSEKLATRYLFLPQHKRVAIIIPSYFGSWNVFLAHIPIFDLQL